MSVWYFIFLFLKLENNPIPVDNWLFLKIIYMYYSIILFKGKNFCEQCRRLQRLKAHLIAWEGRPLRVHAGSTQAALEQKEALLQNYLQDIFVTFQWGEKKNSLLSTFIEYI